jgi:hypothetical protein
LIGLIYLQTAPQENNLKGNHYPSQRILKGTAYLLIENKKGQSLLPTYPRWKNPIGLFLSLINYFWLISSSMLREQLILDRSHKQI